MGPTLATLLLAMGSPPLLVLVWRRVFGETPGLAIQCFLHLVFCATAVAVILVVVRVERRPLSSIKFRRPDCRTVVFGLLLGLGTVWVLPWLTSPFVEALHDPRVESEVRADYDQSIVTVMTMQAGAG